MRKYLLKCTMCKDEMVVEAREEDVAAWRSGELIQRAMPYLSNDAYRMFVVQVCPRCIKFLKHTS